jgi:hypothetical protein
MGAGGRPTYFKMAKNVKSLIIFARDCRAEIIRACVVVTIYYRKTKWRQYGAAFFTSGNQGRERISFQPRG